MFKRHDYILGLTWLVILVLIPLPFIQTLSAGLPAVESSESLAIQLGTVAYVWMLTAIYLSTRPKWLDRLIGLPNMYMMHGIFSLLAIVLAYLHKLGSPSDGWIKTTGDWGLYLLIGLAIYALVMMAGWLTNRVPILARLKQLLETAFKHEVTIWLHRLNLIATGLIFIHVILIDYIRAITPFMVIFVISSLFVFGSYLWSRLQPDYAGQPGTLIKIRPLSTNIQELTIQTKSKLQVKAGDYIFLSFPTITGLKEPHPFSLVNDPKQGQSALILAIRGDGDFTSRLQSLAAPIAVRIMGGFGMYQTVLDDQKPQQLLVIAGGIGAVPLLSIVAAHPEIQTTMFYNAHQSDNLLYPNEFAAWQHRPNFTGYRQITRFSDQAVLSAIPNDIKQLTVLIGGPDSMARHWIHQLKRAGVPRGQIYYEAFSW